MSESTRRRSAEFLVAPSWVLLLAVFAAPILAALYLSFRNETLGAFSAPQFVGFGNYIAALWDPRMHTTKAAY
ncbi:sugar ABC transporter permease [Mesorhizobium ciceri]|uniref:sugar ABC transporter permease n=1 Tax=Mesorhizobium TaxID=68287 RepID=UPI0012DC766C|nr:sugar ABC transporter permease [Mesorhizobium ciceri]